MLKKAIKLTTACSLVVTALLANSPIVLAKTNGNVTVKTDKTNSTITIGNGDLERTFSYKDNKLSTTIIKNLMGKSEFTPKEGSQEFVLNLLPKTELEFKQPTEGTLTSVKPNGQASTVVRPTVSASSTNTDGCGQPSAAIDNNPDTYWASKDGDSNTPEFFEINFGSEKTISKITYQPRKVEGFDAVGRIQTIKVQFDESQDVFQKDLGAAQASFDIDVTGNRKATKLKITAPKSSHWQDTNKDKEMNIAEIDVFDENGKSLVHPEAAPQATTAWKVEASSVQNDDGQGVKALIDGNKTNLYHSRYKKQNGEGTESSMPITITLDRGENAPEFQTFGYIPRPKVNGKAGNGSFLKYEIYTSNDKEKLFEKNNKETTARIVYTNKALEGSTSNEFFASIPKPSKDRFVGIRVLEACGGNFISASEINLYAEKFDSFDLSKFYDTKNASDFTLAGDPVVTERTDKVNGKDKTGKMITFNFAEKDGIKVSQKVVMYNDDHFMRKFLEIEMNDKQQRIDFIDGEHLVVGKDDKKWSIPHVGGVVAMEEFKANLGQPIYVNGMFLGSEFPATRTEFEENLGMIRYYTGKHFDDFKRDNQLTQDGKYVSWQTVLGASPVADSEGNNLDIVKQSFFNYIDSIATPSEFRIQYNSWFDNMMFIDDKNILDSFIEIDKELSKTGVRPLDSYVVDDGWNQYRPASNQLTSADDIKRNGPVSEINKTGFWEFNSKFPQKLTPSSQLVQNFGSNFGVWIGPRGGYNYQGQLAGIMARKGTGSSAGGSIDVADDTYVKNFEKMAIDWMRDYKVNYWKWDGFADGGQYNHFPSGEGVVGYDKDHRHMYGGVHHMYHVTDLWEKWIDLFEHVREKENEFGIKKLWISLTCYVNPSPWFLQWANSVWIQCVADRGERTNGNQSMSDKMNTMLTYRDGAYYDFVVKHQFQFPLQNLYNHDPIYGKTGTGIDANSMNGEQFRNYMFMQGTRGTAFWELYYSDSIFNDEKYLINADFLEWAEGNFDLLKNAIMIGGTPSSTATLQGGVYGNAGEQEAYGFSCFSADGEEAIISMRNPAAGEKVIEFTLDAAIGAKADKAVYNVTTDHAYVQGKVASKAVIPTTLKQGDKVSITLQPGETYVLHLNTKKDAKAPEVSKLFTNASDKLQVQTSEHVSNADFTVKVNGKEVEFTKEDVADLRTFNLTLKTAMKNGDKVEVIAKAGKDSANNTLTGSKSMYYYNKGLLVSKAEVKKDIAVSGLQNSVVGENGFSVSTVVNTKDTNKVLLSQGKDWALGIDADGKAYFTVNGVTVTSKEAVNTGNKVSITAVKENNGILKLYINGKINASAYDAKNKDFKVSPAIIQANAKDVVLNNVKVYNRALGYDELPKTTEAKVENLALHKVPTASWVNKEIKDSVLNEGSPLTIATDGVANDVNKYAIFGQDGKKEASYMQIDLGDVYDVNNVKLYRYWQDQRKYDATALVVSEDENFTNKKVLFYSSDEKTNDVFKLGENPKHDLYNESSDGKDLYKGDFVKARYVRLYAYGRADETGANNNHVNEIQVFGKKDVTDPDTDIPATPLEPGTPVEKPTPKPDKPLTPIGPSTPVEKPTPKPDKPLTPIGPSTPVEKPNTGDGTTIKPVDPKPENKPNKDETGTGDVTNFASVVSVAGVAALGVYLSAKARKDEE